jgi:hypothetical protein
MQACSFPITWDKHLASSLVPWKMGYGIWDMIDGLVLTTDRPEADEMRA